MLSSVSYCFKLVCVVLFDTCVSTNMLCAVCGLKCFIFSEVARTEAMVKEVTDLRMKNTCLQEVCRL